jgi:hypothetical protein
MESRSSIKLNGFFFGISRVRYQVRMANPESTPIATSASAARAGAILKKRIRLVQFKLKLAIMSYTVKKQTDEKNRSLGIKTLPFSSTLPVIEDTTLTG